MYVPIVYGFLPEINVFVFVDHPPNKLAAFLLIKMAQIRPTFLDVVVFTTTVEFIVSLVC